MPFGQGKKPFIVIHSSLVDLMTEAELQAVPPPPEDHDPHLEYNNSHLE